MPIFKENSAIWSTGLSRQVYEHYLWRQITHPWGRKNIRYAIYRHQGVVVSSCKIYRQVISYRHEQLPLFGIGAVFTRNNYRGHGYAGKLLAQVIDAARLERQSGVYLFSDIGEKLYSRLGFSPFQNTNFEIDLSCLERSDSAPSHLPEQDQRVVAHYISEESQHPFDLAPGISNDLLTEMTRHYQRWLSKQPFGTYRNEKYFSFKLGKELFLKRHSSLNWPGKTIWTYRGCPGNFAYAITEEARHTPIDTLRILEIVGMAEGREAIWLAIARYAIEQKFKRIRGWESVVSDFSPSFSWRELCPDTLKTELSNTQFRIRSREKGWAQPMLLPFDQRLNDWWSYFPCPFLELDHF